MLAVLHVNQAPPASADHGRNTDVWSATLMAQSTQAGPGCSTPESPAAKKCSTVSTLTDDEFTYLGVNYRIDQISYASNALAFSFAQSDIPAAFEDLTLYVNNVPIPRGSVAIVPGFGIMTYTSTSLPAISAGDTVQLKLVQEYWTGVDLYGGNMVHTSDGAQYMDINQGSVRTFKVRLDQAPTANVTITFSKLATGFGIDDFDAVDPDPETVTFTTSNWQTGQDVAVVASGDAAVGDSIIISARVSIAGSAAATDPYRNPARRNGFVVTVKQVGGL